MQHDPSHVSSGHIAPTVIGPRKNMKDVMILSGFVLFLGGFWPPPGTIARQAINPR